VEKGRRKERDLEGGTNEEKEGREEDIKVNDI
jgi:hypothetical protein